MDLHAELTRRMIQRIATWRGMAHPHTHPDDYAHFTRLADEAQADLNLWLGTETQTEQLDRKGESA